MSIKQFLYHKANICQSPCLLSTACMLSTSHMGYYSQTSLKPICSCAHAYLVNPKLSPCVQPQCKLSKGG